MATKVKAVSINSGAPYRPRYTTVLHIGTPRGGQLCFEIRKSYEGIGDQPVPGDVVTCQQEVVSILLAHTSPKYCSTLRTNSRKCSLSSF